MWRSGPVNLLWPCLFVLRCRDVRLMWKTQLSALPLGVRWPRRQLYQLGLAWPRPHAHKLYILLGKKKSRKKNRHGWMMLQQLSNSNHAPVTHTRLSFSLITVWTDTHKLDAKISSNKTLIFIRSFPAVWASTSSLWPDPGSLFIYCSIF